MINFASEKYVKSKARQITSEMAHHGSAIIFGRKYFAKEENTYSERKRLTITREESPFKTGQKPEPTMMRNLEI